jgi:hypothetical protein
VDCRIRRAKKKIKISNQKIAIAEKAKDYLRRHVIPEI